MSLITINSRADMEQEFERGRRKGRREVLSAIASLIKEEVIRFKNSDQGLNSRGYLTLIRIS